MDIQHYITILRRRIWIIVITVLITEIVIIIGTIRMKPTYSATTTIRISLATFGTVSYQDYMYADRLINTYIKLATTTPVLDELKLRLELIELPPIEVTTIPNTELIQITVQYNDPNMAALAANTLAAILINQSLELYTGSGDSSLELLSSQVSSMEQQVNQAREEYVTIVKKNPDDTEGIQTAKQMLDLKQQMYASILEQYEQLRLKETLRIQSISMAEPAILPIKPIKPLVELNIALGFLVGMIGGLGLAFLFENLDTTLYTTDQIEAITKLPSIGEIPPLGKHPSFSNTNSNFAYVESLRRLRTNILSVEPQVRTLLVASAERREGKSTVIAYLAYIMAQSGRNVVVVDGDLRVPSQHKLFNIENNVGLSSVLEQKSTFTEALQSSEFQGVHILPSGPLPANPSELLGSDQMKLLVNQLSHDFDLVIIDTPATLAVIDAVVLAPMVDAVAIVYFCGKISAKAAQSVLTQLNSVKAKLIGVIVNRAEINLSRYYYYYRKE